MTYTNTTSIITEAKAISEADWRDIQRLADKAADSLSEYHVRKRASARFAIIEQELKTRAKTGLFHHPSEVHGLDYIHLTSVDWQENWRGTHEFIGEAVLVHDAEVNENDFVTGREEIRNSHMYGFVSHARVNDMAIYFIVPDTTAMPQRELTPQGPFFNFDDFEHLPTIPAARTAATAHASHMSDYVWEDTTGLLFDEPQAGDDMPDWFDYC